LEFKLTVIFSHYNLQTADMSGNQRQACKQSPDNFCYVCGKFLTTKTCKRKINLDHSYAKAYESYFGMKIGDQDKPWAPTYICGTCSRTLDKWMNCSKVSMPFYVPRIWREPKNHVSDCYFCMVAIPQWQTSKNLEHIVYPDIESSIAPVYKSDKEDSEILLCNNVEDDLQYTQSSSEDDSNPRVLSYKEFDELVRNLKLSKEQTEYLGSFLKARNFMEKSVCVPSHRRRHEKYSLYFRLKDSFCYCFDIHRLFTAMNIDYITKDWVLFLDSSTTSMKALLMHIEKKYPSIPIGYGVKMKENYDNIKLLLDSIDYKTHKWHVCGDFKIISFLRGIQAGYPKYCCFICLWDSRNYNLHYQNPGQWPAREEHVIGKYSIQMPFLVPIEFILMPTLHIKLGIFSQFIKAIEGPPIQELKDMFPLMTSTKVESGIFTGPQIRKVLASEIFINKLDCKQTKAFNSMKLIFEKFLGLECDPNSKRMIDELMKNFKNINANMSLKMHMLHSHADFFKHNIKVSDQHGERFHQELLPFEKRYKGKCPVNMIGDYIWSVLRDSA